MTEKPHSVTDPASTEPQNCKRHSRCLMFKCGRCGVELHDDWGTIGPLYCRGCTRRRREDDALIAEALKRDPYYAMLQSSHDGLLAKVRELEAELARSRATAFDYEVEVSNFEEEVARLKAVAADGGALARVRALPVKWDAEAAEYPRTSAGMHAKAGVELCAQELRSALAAAPPAFSPVRKCAGCDGEVTTYCSAECEYRSREASAEPAASLSKCTKCGGDCMFCTMRENEQPSEEPAAAEKVAVCGAWCGSEYVVGDWYCSLPIGHESVHLFNARDRGSAGR